MTHSVAAGARRLVAASFSVAILFLGGDAIYAQEFNEGVPGEAVYVADSYVGELQESQSDTSDPSLALTPASYGDQGYCVDETACGQACCDCGQAACQCPPKRKCHGFVFGEFLYLRPTDGDITHAQQQDGLGGAGTAPFGQIASISQNYEPGFRVGIGFNLDESASIVGSYTFFESSAEDSLDIPTIPAGTGAVRSLVHHPLSTITASTGPVDATYDIDFQMADVLFQDLLIGEGWCSVGYSLGAVYGNLEQEFAQTGNFAGGAAGTIDTDTMIDFSGGGLKAGLNLERHVGHGILVYGNLTAAAMSGRFNADYTMLNSTTDVLLANAVWEDNRVISHVEYEIGVRLRTSNDRFRLSAGYQFQHWGNVVTTSDFIDAVQADNYTNLGDTLSFDGLVARIECNW